MLYFIFLIYFIWLFILILYIYFMLYYLFVHVYLFILAPGGTVVKNLPANTGGERDTGLIPGVGGSSGEGK